MKDIVRIVSAVPIVDVGNVEYNFKEIVKMIDNIEKNEKPDFIVFPELSLTGYTCGDLFFQENLITAVREEIKNLKYLFTDSIGIIGAPLNIGGQLYNCAIAMCRGHILGVVPKTYLPNYNEFYEKRWFSSANDLPKDLAINNDLYELNCGETVPIGNNLVFNAKNIKFGMEICEDLWTPLPPSTVQSLGGAEIIFNLSASNETIAKRKYRENLVKQQSARNIGIYVYTSAGTTESTSDLVFSGNSIMAENGSIVCENEEFLATNYYMVHDFDIAKIKADRIKNKSFKDTAATYQNLMPIQRINYNIDFEFPRQRQAEYLNIKKLPFVPSTKTEREQRCKEIFSMQVEGLKKRLFTTDGKAIIGVSGGLDSTLALLVCTQAMKSLGKNITNVIGITMPCFGTTDKTKNNSLDLMKALGISSKKIPINDTCLSHLKDIGLDPHSRSVAFENAQARERTQVLMDYANKVGGMVIGTGDLSELALGWCTYNGDHMSMYAVNTSIPKTLVRWMIDTIKEFPEFKNCKEILTDILNTPISPELLPPDENGKIIQKTEDTIGPYALHDFFLYYMLRYGFSPTKIYEYAKKAFATDFSDTDIKKWIKVFYSRFFSQQFKRNCLPDGVKVGSVALSPRGDWRMPSDANASLWLKEIEKL